jgi:hypothetical protein
MIVVDGITGLELMRPTIPPSTFESQLGSTSSDGFTPVGQPMVDPEGSIQVEYAVRQVQPNQQMTAVLSLLTIALDGSTSVRELSTSTSGNLWPNQIIPDGQAGLLATWVGTPNQGTATTPYQAAHVSSGGVTVFDMPLAPAAAANDPRTHLPLPLSLALGENANTAFVSYGTDIVAFDVSSGNPIWNYSAAPLPLAIVRTEVNGGVAAKIANADGTETVTRFTAGGSPTTAAWSGAGIDYVTANLWIDATEAISMRAAETIDVSTSGWISPDQGGTGQATQNLHVTNASDTGPNQAVIASVFGKIKAGLDGGAYPACQAWLQGPGGNASPLIQALLDTNHFGHGTFNTPDTLAFVGTTLPNGMSVGVPAEFAVTVADNNLFFQAGNGAIAVGRRKYSGNTLRGQAAILVHELAHMVGAPGFQHDFGLPKNGAANDALVDTNCRTLIEGIR